MIRTGLMVLLAFAMLGNSAQAKPFTIVLFGDSNTSASNWKKQSYDTDATWANLLNDHYQDARVINAGVSGDTTEDARKRFFHDVINKQPALVLIMFGTNDAHLNRQSEAKVDKKTFEINMTYFIEEIEKNDGKAVLVTCLPIIEGNGSDGYYYAHHPKSHYHRVGGARSWHDSYNDIVRTIAEKEDIPLVDLWKRIVDVADGDDDQRLIDSGMIDPSGYHLTPKGAELLVNEIIKSVSNLKNGGVDHA